MVTSVHVRSGGCDAVDAAYQPGAVVGGRDPARLIASRVQGGSQVAPKPTTAVGGERPKPQRTTRRAPGMARCHATPTATTRPLDNGGLPPSHRHRADVSPSFPIARDVATRSPRRSRLTRRGRHDVLAIDDLAPPAHQTRRAAESPLRLSGDRIPACMRATMTENVRSRVGTRPPCQLQRQRTGQEEEMSRGGELAAGTASQRRRPGSARGAHGTCGTFGPESSAPNENERGRAGSVAMTWPPRVRRGAT
jgi:hypothetical protein